MAEQVYAVTIFGLADAYAETLVRRFLAVIFKGRSEEEMAAALTQLPLLLTADVSHTAAKTLEKHLSARGARVLVQKWDLRLNAPIPAGGRRSTAVPRGFEARPPAASSSTAASPSASTTSLTETTYSFRPHTKEHIRIHR